MKNFHRFSLLCFVFLTSNLFSYDVQNGKKLYDEAKCQKCHIESDYTSDERKVYDYARLKWRVQRCDFTMNAGWFEEDIDDVTEYLNDSYYKFEKDKVVAEH